MGRKKTPEPHNIEYPIVIETYYQMGNYEINRFENNTPSTCNGDVRIRRYRITVELIDEPFEVIKERLIKLWREDEGNYHHTEPMKAMAKKIGMDPKELTYDTFGIDNKKRTR